MFDSPPPSTMTFGIEQVDHARERARHSLLVPCERRIRQRIAGRSSLRDLLRRQARASALDVVARQRRTRQKRLDAAAPSAVARRPRRLDAARGRQRIVSPLAANRVRADQHPPMDHHAAARTGADDDAEDHLGAGRRAVGRLRQREAVGVVGKPDRPIEPARQILGQRPAVQPGRVRILDESRRRRDRARDADADGAGRAGGLLDVAHQAARPRPGCSRSRRAAPRSAAAAARLPRRQSQSLRSSYRPGRCRSACLRQSYIAS